MESQIHAATSDTSRDAAPTVPNAKPPARKNPRSSTPPDDLEPAPAIMGAPAQVREVKVRLPLDQVLRLHLTRMTNRTNVSQIVSTALTRYFDELAHSK